jgi:cysteinyl-tRNA synthetase
MTIQLHNSLTDRKEPFEPVTPRQVGMYLCGPTVYKPSHIGHAVGPVIFDTIKRYLTHRGFSVTWVVNITDVDDKLIVEAAEQGTTVPELAGRVTAKYHDAMAALAVTGVDHFPKASEHIAGIIAMCERLIAQDAAYVLDGDVYFDVTADADYGKLSNRKLDEQMEGSRELAGKAKRHPGDFALWKAAKPDEPDEVRFDSPWGSGRPGWHIECSAMALALLGETFDIHGGGLDLIFPHHENELAQSETCTHQPFAKYWLHHGLTKFNTKKVSKSDPAMQQVLLSMTLENLLTEYSGELLRYFILSTHYRSPIEYSPAELAAKGKALATFHRLFRRINELADADVYAQVPAGAKLADWSPAATGMADHPELADGLSDAFTRFHAAMDDDFNTAAALAVLFELANTLNRCIEQGKLEAPEAAAGPREAVLAAGRFLIGLGRILGLFEQPPPAPTVGDETLARVIDAHISVRARCRADKLFALSDQIRDGLKSAGIALEDKPEGTRWEITGITGTDLLDQLMALHIAVRKSARATQNYALADAIRDELAQTGITLEDKSGGTTWSTAP